MDVFGLTPVDSALSAWGLNCAQNLIEFFFAQTHLGILSFVIGFLWSLWQSIREANFKHITVFVFVSLAIFFLIILPKRQDHAFQSIAEANSSSSNTAQALKDSQTNADMQPLFLSFFNHMGESVVMGAISVIDKLLVHDLRFLSDPLGLLRVSLQANQAVYNSIGDFNLRQDLEDFIYGDYLPSLYMYLYATNYGGDLYSLWPGDSRIINYYSSDAQGRWSNLQNRILAHIDNPSAPWIGVKNALNQFQINTSRIDDQIIASLIRAQIHTQSQPWWCRWAGAMQTFFSYSYGAANFLLYASFPVLLLIIIIFRRLSLFLQYAEFLIWIKSWILTAAFSHYISLIAARVQAQATPSTMNWFWDYPYYTLLASILLYVLPALTFIGIYRSFQFINNTSLLAGRQGGQND